MREQLQSMGYQLSPQSTETESPGSQQQPAKPTVAAPTGTTAAETTTTTSTSPTTARSSPTANAASEPTGASDVEPDSHREAKASGLDTQQSVAMHSGARPLSAVQCDASVDLSALQKPKVHVATGSSVDASVAASQSTLPRPVNQYRQSIQKLKEALSEATLM